MRPAIVVGNEAGEAPATTLEETVMTPAYATTMANLDQAYDRFQTAQTAVQQDSSKPNLWALSLARRDLQLAHEAYYAARTPGRCCG